MTTAISNNHAVVVIEDLKVRNMSKSAAGTKDHPGLNVKQKSGLNWAILDQAWGERRRQLEYKQERRVGRVLAVPPYGTSQQMPALRSYLARQPQDQAVFLCQSRGHAAHADEVSSMNILSRGIEVLRDEGRDTGRLAPGGETTARIACEVKRCSKAVSSRNPPASMRRLVGIPGLQAGEGVKTRISAAPSGSETRMPVDVG